MKKRLYKIEQGKKIDGVCGGIAEYKGDYYYGNMESLARL